MNRFRRLVSSLTLMAFVGCLLAMPVTVNAQSWSDRSSGYDRGMNVWNRSWGNNSGFHTGGIGTTLKKILPGLLGGVAGYFLGASLGPIGRIAAAAVGFVVAKWIADKLFPSRDRYTYSDWNRDNSFGWRNQFNQNSGWSQFPTWRGSETGGATGGDANLGTLRDRWISATTEYQNSLRSGNTSQQESARRTFEQAREAYYGAIAASNR